MDIQNYLVTESDRIVYDIEERVLAGSIWPGVVNRKPWPERMGVMPSNVEWQRPWIQDEVPWEDVALNDSTGTQCIPPKDTVEINNKTRPMKLQQKAVESPDFCVTDLIFTEAREEQMGKIVDNLSDQARWLWVKRIREEYHRVCKTKLILTADLPGQGLDQEDNADGMDTVEPTSILVNGLLDLIYRELILEGASSDSFTVAHSKPAFALITDVFTSRYLTRGDATLREDIRYTDEANSFLGPLGIDCTYNGFIHLIDEMPRRWDFVTGAWVERQPFVKVGGSPDVNGLPQGDATVEINPLWLAAAYQDSYVFCPSVMNLLVPPSITGAAGAEYMPQNYVGEFKFRNIPDRADNPDENMGFFRGKLMSGTEFVKPQWGYVIRHQVASSQMDLIDGTTMLPL